jgi:hypothetical protein
MFAVCFTNNAFAMKRTVFYFTALQLLALGTARWASIHNKI